MLTLTPRASYAWILAWLPKGRGFCTALAAHPSICPSIRPSTRLSQRLQGPLTVDLPQKCILWEWPPTQTLLWTRHLPDRSEGEPDGTQSQRQVMEVHRKRVFISCDACGKKWQQKINISVTCKHFVFIARGKRMPYTLQVTVVS